VIRATRSRVASILVLAGLALASCATGSTGGTTAPPSTTSSPTLTVSTPAPSTPVSTPTASPTLTTTTAPPTKSATATRTTLPSDYCTASQLTMRILPGGAEPNYEIAAVTFTNKSASSCTLSGYPSVQLFRGGTVLVTASANSTKAPKLVRLGAGLQAQAQIRDKITCQAPLSDSVHVVAPAPLTSLHLESTSPLVQLRGCTVTVDPIVLSS
jgi:hypothetical protein